MNRGRRRMLDRRRLADRLRRRPAYAEAVEALVRPLPADPALQMEILAAGCGVVEGAPAIGPLTQDHLAVVLAVAELQQADPASLRRRLDRFAGTFSCSSFETFRERLAAYRQSRVPVEVAASSTSDAVRESARYFDWGTAWPGRAVAALLLAGLSIALIVAMLQRDSDSLVRAGAKATKSAPAAASALPAPSSASILDDDVMTIERLDELLSQQPVPLPLPENGEVRTFGVLPRVAPLEIKAPGASDGLVKLRSWDTNAAVMTVFVRRNKSATVKVPLGTYKLRYTGGNHWYGYQDCFGPENVCWEATQPFSFTQERGKVRGYTITLYDVPGNTLRKRTIDLADF